MFIFGLKVVLCIIIIYLLIDIKDKLMISSVNDIFIRFQKERNEIYGGKDCRKLLATLVVMRLQLMFILRI